MGGEKAGLIAGRRGIDGTNKEWEKRGRNNVN